MKYEDYSVFDFLKDDSFVKWVKNPSSESEMFWKAWLKEHPEKSEVVAQAKKVVRSLQYTSPRFEMTESDEVLSSILSKIPDNTSQHHAKRTVERHVPRTTSFFRIGIAAVISLTVLFTAYWWLFPQSSSDETVATIEEKTVVRENPAGVKSKIKLPDGTLVHLNAKSTLKSPSQFAADKRVVRLEGEAFFSVAEDSNRPFTVITNQIATTALGTSFNIRAYETEGGIQVSLVSGKVKVDQIDNSKSVQLTPEEQLSWLPGGELFEKSTFDAADVLAWTRNTIIFKDADFNAMVAVLSDWYGVEFVVKKKPTEMEHYTGRFKDKSLEQVLKQISFSSNFEFNIEDNTVIIQ